MHLGDHRFLEAPAIALGRIPHFDGHAEESFIAVRGRRRVTLPALAEHDLHLVPLAAANQVQRQRFADAVLADQAHRLLGTGDRGIVDTVDYVMRFQLFPARSFVGGFGHHQRAAAARNLEHLGFVGGQRTDDAGKSGVAPARRPETQIGNRLHHQVDRHREADADVGTGTGRVDRGVDADDVAAAVEKRAARVARIDGGVGLQVRRGAVAKALGVRNNPAADGIGIAPERIADGEGFIAGLHPAGVAEYRLRHLVTVFELENGDVVSRGCIDDPGGNAGGAIPATRKNLDQRRIFDNVVVGPDFAITRRHQEPGSVVDFPHRVAEFIDGHVGHGANGNRDVEHGFGVDAVVAFQRVNSKRYQADKQA